MNKKKKKSDFQRSWIPANMEVVFAKKITLGCSLQKKKKRDSFNDNPLDVLVYHD